MLFLVLDIKLQRSLQINEVHSFKIYNYQAVMSIFDMDSLSNMFVRPTRQVYKKSDLGKTELKIGNTKFNRYDFQLPTSKQGFLQCSLFCKYSQQELHLIDKCMIYLHCNTGCRIEGLPYVKYLLPEDYAVILFDFTGSGISSGDYISLGFNQTYDIKVVVNHLRRLNRFMKIGLWGRSMGAVAAIRYCSVYSDISIAILDSPFSSLIDLALDLGNKRTYIPKFLLSVFFRFLNSRIVQKAGIGLYEIDNKEIINKVNIPMVFLTSTKDSVVPNNHVEELFEEFKGEKQLIYIEKDHNELRDPETIRNIIKHMKNAFTLQKHQSQSQILNQVHEPLRQHSMGNIINAPYRISLTKLKNQDKMSVQSVQSHYSRLSQQQHPVYNTVKPMNSNINSTNQHKQNIPVLNFKRK